MNVIGLSLWKSSRQKTTMNIEHIAFFYYTRILLLLLLLLLLHMKNSNSKMDEGFGGWDDMWISPLLDMQGSQLLFLARVVGCCWVGKKSGVLELWGVKLETCVLGFHRKIEVLFSGVASDQYVRPSVTKRNSIVGAI